jgi:hypothetical protein
MMGIIRTLITGVFLYFLIVELRDYPQMSDLNLLFLAAYALGGGLIVGLFWVPVVGERLSEPLTSCYTEETSLPQVSHSLVRLIHRFQGQGHHRLALLLCFLEGMRQPDLPHPPLLALRSVRPGSLLERWFAREVYRYHNVQNCLHAYRLLVERHGRTPPPHPDLEVRLALLQSQREPNPVPTTTFALKPDAGRVELKRNPDIKLFEN